MKTAAILLRVSTNQQDMESQKNDLLPVVKNMNYYVPDQFIFGQKITGKDNVRNEERQSLKDLKTACDTGEIDAVFINEVSRLSRGSIAGRKYVEDFTLNKIPLYFKDISMWTIEPSTMEVQESNIYFIGMLFDQAERELKLIMKRTERGRKQNAREGKVTGAYMKFGYKKDITTGKYAIDPEESTFILDIVDKYLTGKYSIRALTNYANTSGVKTRYQKDNKKGTYTTKGGIVKKADNVMWTTKAIRELLTSKMYLGERTFQDITYNIPPIYDEDIYNKIQERLKLNVHNIPKEKKYTHLLQRLLICGNCGNTYYGHFKNRNNTYLCSSYTKSAQICNNSALNYERVESIIWHFVLNYTYFYKQITVEEKDRLIAEQTNKRAELQELRVKYTNLKKGEELKVQNLVNLVIEGVFTMDEIKKQKGTIDSLLNNYNIELERIDNELDRIEKRIQGIGTKGLTKVALKHIESDRNLRKEKINEIIEKIVVYKLKNSIVLLQVHYLERVYNILYRFRSFGDRYYVVDDGVATFNNPYFQSEDILKAVGNKIPEFTVTSNNNDVFDELVFGSYSGKQLIEIMENMNLYNDYVRDEPQVSKIKASKATI